jgi:tetratricopeptide (TPR) repeat protein
MIERSQSALAIRNGMPRSISALLILDLAQLDAWSGRIEEAHRLLKNASPDLRPAIESPAARMDLAYANGFSAMYLGRHREADSQLREALEMATLVYGANGPEAWPYYQSLAMNLRMQGRFDDAASVLSTAPSLQPVRGTTGHPDAPAIELRVARARVELDRGNPAAAIRLLPEVGDGFGSLSDYGSVRGELLCALGQPREGLTQIESFLEEVTPVWYEYDPDIARSRAVAGLCALAAGDRPKAVELADKARDAFAHQPSLSVYFRAPSERLDRLLQSSASDHPHK